MKIKDGGAVSNIPGTKVEEIKIDWDSNENYIFELWINDSCLSYLTINELLELKTEIKVAIMKAIK